MILSEILDYVGSAYLDDRTDLVDGDADELWSDETIVRFLNEGQRILTRRAWVIIETGGVAGQIVLATEKALYPLHKSVLKVFHAVPSTQVAPLGRASDASLLDPFPTGYDAFDRGEAASLSGSTATTGAALTFATDAGTRMVRVYPEPTSTENGTIITLKIARMPLVYLTVDDTDAEPEVPEEYHMALCDYAAGRCLTLPNVDSDAKKEGRDILADFQRQVREARQDRQRMESDGLRWGFDTATSEIR